MLHSASVSDLRSRPVLQMLDMPGLPGETTEVDREGHKMSRYQERRLPTELLIAIGDQVSAQNPC